MNFKNAFWQEHWDSYDRRVKDLISELIEHKLIQLFCHIDYCESPIEQLLYIALLEISEVRINFQHIILPQEKVNCGDNNYRVDFLILIGDYIYNRDKCIKLVIECDGHPFHEKTKAQAARDKQRDRNLIAAGYQVMHFTGSEIWQDPFKCAHEVIEMILKINK